METKESTQEALINKALGLSREFLTFYDIPELTSRFKLLSTEKPISFRRKLTDYLSEELCSSDYTKSESSLNIISRLIFTRALEINYSPNKLKEQLFRDYAETPESFMSCLLGPDRWEIIQDRVFKRDEAQSRKYQNIIEREINY